MMTRLIGTTEPMSVENLIERALEQAGTVVAIVVHPERGPDASLRYVNQAFASLLNRPRAALKGVRFDDVATFVSDPTTSAALLQALVSGKPSTLDLPLLVGGAEKWLGLRLTFAAPNETGARHAIITGRDITEARRDAKNEADLRRLLASIFIGINAPVAIVTSAGEISMANPAFCHLHGYAPEEMKRLCVDDLTPPEYAEAASAARAKQLSDGERYEMKFETITKGGRRSPVLLTSVLLRDGDQRMRVVTLMPDCSAASPLPMVPPPPGARADRGELRALSVEAFRSVFGDTWERIASRAMLRADQIIRKRLRRGDTVSIVDDHKFVIWFAGADEDRNEATLAAMVREIRLRFLNEFGEQAAGHVDATLIPAAPEPDPAQRSKLPGLGSAESATAVRHWK